MGEDTLQPVSSRNLSTCGGSIELFDPQIPQLLCRLISDQTSIVDLIYQSYLAFSISPEQVYMIISLDVDSSSTVSPAHNIRNISPLYQFTWLICLD